MMVKVLAGNSLAAYGETAKAPCFIALPMLLSVYNWRPLSLCTLSSM